MNNNNARKKKQLQRTFSLKSYNYFLLTTTTTTTTTTTMTQMLLLLLFFCYFSSITTAELVGSILLPHGDFAYDPTLFKPGTIERRIAKEVAIGSRRAGRWLIIDDDDDDTVATTTRMKPDIILLTTPHGIKLDNDFGLYIAPKGVGTAVIGDDLYDNNDDKNWKEPYNVSLEVNLAPDLTSDLLTDLLANPETANVSGIYSYNDVTPIPLNWGEIIPLLMLPQQEAGVSNNKTRYMILSMPQRRYDHGPDMVPELLRLGKAIEIWAQNRPERIGVIISGDLSHTHQAEGPYGYSNTSAIYDNAIGHWAADPCGRADSLLQVASNLQPTALSCGFTGYVLWHGMMACGREGGGNNYRQHSHSAPTTKKKYESQVLVNRNVTYYGMMAAIFAPSEDEGHFEIFSS